MSRRGFIRLCVLSLLVTWENGLFAQQPDVGTMPLSAACARAATAGSAAERTLSIVSLLTQNPVATSLRPFAASTVAAILNDSAVAPLGAGQLPSCSTRLRPSSVSLWYNTNDRNLDRDGAVWQGKGVTVALTSGIGGGYRVIQVELQPIAIVSENRPYALSGVQSAPGDFRDPFWGQAIDLPYRFGDHAYATVDPGESIVQVTWSRLAAGGTTRSQHWGPAHFYPLVIGTEGIAYPRLFAEFVEVPMWIARVTAEWQLGFLEASRYNDLPIGGRSRLAPALVVSVRPASFPFIELGGTRFFHVRREPGSVSWRTATLPFTGILKQGSTDQVVGGFNQLGSAFVRIAPPNGTVEFYGELYREDHNTDFRDMAGEPDHASAYMLGLRKAYKSDGVLTAVTIEHANGRMSHLARVRSQGPVYVHNAITEGHTHKGQPLGSSALLGGGGTIVAWDRIQRTRSLSVSLELKSVAQDREGGTRNGELMGMYLLRVSERRLIRQRILSQSIGLAGGYGAQRGGLRLILGFGAGF